MITGSAFIGEEERVGGASFQAWDPAAGEPLDPPFRESGATDVEDACAFAASAAPDFAALPPSQRAAFLEAVGEEILALGDTLILRAMQETALPRARLESERGRTVGQLAYLARVLRAGTLYDATLDSAQPARVPLPRPDLRRHHLAVGPVAVFGASNFPLAFSVAGGDTAAAFAAGCPVVVKGHPAHPGTGELVARAIIKARRRCALQPGVFAYLPGAQAALGAALVADARIQAVGFTGSRTAGVALMKVAAQRAQPIPVFAEMSSVNPVFLFPGAAHRRGEELAKAYVASLALGAGQFCTNPGILIGVGNADFDAFVSFATTALQAVPAQPMLSAGIAGNYARGLAALRARTTVTELGRGAEATAPNRCRAALLAVEADDLLADAGVREEVFGAASVIVRAGTIEDFARIARQLEGQLTATLLYDEDDIPAVARLMPELERRAGRLLGNAWPTGVEVADAMVHGGPYPATSDGRSSSVGALAVERFLRPVCYQNLDARLLPPAVQDANPWRLPRRTDGLWQPAPTTESSP